MSRARPGARLGCTLADVLVGAAMVVVLTGLMAGLAGLVRRSERIGERDACTQVAILVQERIETDLRRLVVGPGARSANVRADGSAIGFWSLAGEPAEDGALPVNGVVYRAETRGKRMVVVRSTGERSEVLGAPYVRSVRFALAWTSTGTVVLVCLQLHATGEPRHTTFRVKLTAPTATSTADVLRSWFRPTAEFPDAELNPGGNQPK